MNSIFELSLNQPSLQSMQASACGENRTKGFDMKQLLERFSYKFSVSNHIQFLFNLLSNSKLR